MNREYARRLKNFADKLATDDSMPEEVIKSQMEELGLIYSTDEIERLNHVLLALHPLSEEIKSNENTHKELSH